MVVPYGRRRLGEGLDKKGIKVYEGVMKNRYDLAGILRFLDILRNAKPDILYIAGQTLSQAAGLWGSLFVKIPVKVLGFHSHDLAYRPLCKLFIDKLSIRSA